MSGQHSKSTLHDSVTGDALRAQGDWRLSLVRQFSELMELLARDWTAPGQSTSGDGASGPASGADAQVPEADSAACTCCVRCVSTRDRPEASSALPQPLDASVAAHLEQAWQEFATRPLSQHDYVALWLDAAYVLGTQYVFCMGATMTGRKRILSFAASSLEDAAALSQMLQQLTRRGLCTERGLLCVISGGSGLYEALAAHFGARVQVQRCQVQKARRVLSYLPEAERLAVRSALRHAWEAADYDTALRALMRVHSAVSRENHTAGRCLQEGLKQTLTLHRAGVFAALGRSLKTTSVIGRVSQRLAAHLRPYAHWLPPQQRQACMALGLLTMETRLYRLANASYLARLRSTLFSERLTSS